MPCTRDMSVGMRAFSRNVLGKLTPTIKRTVYNTMHMLISLLRCITFKEEVMTSRRPPINGDIIPQNNQNYELLLGSTLLYVKDRIISKLSNNIDTVVG